MTEEVVAVVVHDGDEYLGRVKHVEQDAINKAKSDSLGVTLRALAAVCEGDSE